VLRGGSRAVVWRAEGAMGLGIESPSQQFLLDIGLPVVLYLVVRPPRQSPCNKRLLVANEGVQFDDEIVFVF